MNKMEVSAALDEASPAYDDLAEVKVIIGEKSYGIEAVEYSSERQRIELHVKGSQA
jgi:hypothetical protein